jgi:hypothetical protein
MKTTFTKPFDLKIDRTRKILLGYFLTLCSFVWSATVLSILRSIQLFIEQTGHDVEIHIPTFLLWSPALILFFIGHRLAFQSIAQVTYDAVGQHRLRQLMTYTIFSSTLSIVLGTIFSLSFVDVHNAMRTHILEFPFAIEILASPIFLFVGPASFAYILFHSLYLSEKICNDIRNQCTQKRISV